MKCDITKTYIRRQAKHGAMVIFFQCFCKSNSIAWPKTFLHFVFEIIFKTDGRKRGFNANFGFESAHPFYIAREPVPFEKNIIRNGFWGWHSTDRDYGSIPILEILSDEELGPELTKTRLRKLLVSLCSDLSPHIPRILPGSFTSKAKKRRIKSKSLLISSLVRSLIFSAEAPLGSIGGTPTRLVRIQH